MIARAISKVLSVGLVLGLTASPVYSAERGGTWLVRTKGQDTQQTLWQDGSVTALAARVAPPTLPLVAPARGRETKPELKLEPFGRSKDDRKEIQGNRGRPIHETPAKKEKEDKSGPAFSFSRSIYFTFDEFNIWKAWYYTAVEGQQYKEGRDYGCLSYSATRQCLNDFVPTTGMRYAIAGLDPLLALAKLYTPEEIAVLKTLTRDQAALAANRGYVLASPVATPLLPIKDLDLSKIVNFASPTTNKLGYVSGDTIGLKVSLTNPFDKAITLTVSAHAAVVTQTMSMEFQAEAKYCNGRQGCTTGFQLPVMDYKTASQPATSTQTWHEVTIKPGETVVLDGNYEFLGSPWPHAYQVTVKDSKSGLSYTDPLAGWHI